MENEKTVNSTTSNVSTNKKGFLNLSLFLLLQGQFISMMGDMIYEIALGFWVLAFTGSPALMGTLMATSLLPGVILSPFAGVVVDRSNRKRLMILMDLIRGITIIIVAIAAIMGLLQLWMVFLAGIILGIGGAFFGPAAMSVLPQMVPRDKLTNANSLFGVSNTGADILGNSLGGILYVLIGAPLMFLLNGISFILSGISISFAKIPKSRESKITTENFLSDLKESTQFVWKLKGLLYILLIFSIFSFLVHIAVVLLIPLFQFTPGLGAAKYGIAVACFTVGVFMGMVVLSTVNVHPSKKATLMLISLTISNLCLILFALTTQFYLMALLLLIAGLSESVVNVFILSSIQSVVPDEMMGKVMGLVGTITMALTPLAMVTGGVLAEIFPIRTIFLVCFVGSFLVFVNLFFIKSVRRFINFDPTRDSREDLI
ncbi:MFS transporter [Methanobacterium formicicum]|uniref:Major facilitator superfamily protein n=1 Tax=Methanobacterium formicicum (strain DSM 3637 / PP1) TaxID=1204725 RepID=K2R0W6_METFP|nr:MFS transporter [Methanobacterium formicicum]EKF86183.1 major facilitator superfamily protein [Methanobacterium formicicum DSM 3637]